MGWDRGCFGSSCHDSMYEFKLCWIGMLHFRKLTANIIYLDKHMVYIYIYIYIHTKYIIWRSTDHTSITHNIISV